MRFEPNEAIRVHNRIDLQTEDTLNYGTFIMPSVTPDHLIVRCNGKSYDVPSVMCYKKREKMTRKFHKTIIQVTVLSEEPFDYDALSDVHSAITDGDCVGSYETILSLPLDGPTMVKALNDAGSEPGFFRLDDEGNDVDDEEQRRDEKHGLYPEHEDITN